MIDIPTTLRKVCDAVGVLGGQAEILEIGPPAAVEDVEAVERIIGRSIPQTLRTVFLEQSARVNVSWTISGAALPRAVNADWLGGGLDLALADLPIDWSNWEGWRPAFESPADHGLPLEFNLDVYDDLFPLVTVGNGDQIVVARADDEDSDYVIYLNHEGGDLPMMVLSDTLDEFFNTWCQLGCPGPEWSTMVAFMDPEALRLSLATRRSSAWLEVLSGQRRTRR